MSEYEQHQDAIRDVAYRIWQNEMKRVESGIDPYTQEVMTSRPDQLTKDNWGIAQSLVDTYGAKQAMKIVQNDSTHDRSPKE